MADVGALGVGGLVSPQMLLAQERLAAVARVPLGGLDGF